jgi:hypothetical protein
LVIGVEVLEQENNRNLQLLGEVPSFFACQQRSTASCRALRRDQMRAIIMKANPHRLISFPGLSSRCCGLQRVVFCPWAPLFDAILTLLLRSS